MKQRTYWGTSTDNLETSSETAFLLQLHLDRIQVGAVKLASTELFGGVGEDGDVERVVKSYQLPL